jgi:hypothetical protein
MVKMYIKDYTTVVDPELELNTTVKIASRQVKEYTNISNLILCYGVSSFVGLGTDTTTKSTIALNYVPYVVASRLGYLCDADNVLLDSTVCVSFTSGLVMAEKMLTDNPEKDVVLVNLDFGNSSSLKDVFNSLGITGVKFNSGLAVYLLSSKPSKYYIENPTTIRFNSSNPILTDAAHYVALMRKFSDFSVSCVKKHDTGTANNTETENTAVREVFGDIHTLSYKPIIGHCMGSSGGVELGILLDSGFTGNVLNVSAGMGNIYGGFLAGSN